MLRPCSSLPGTLSNLTSTAIFPFCDRVCGNSFWCVASSVVYVLWSSFRPATFSKIIDGTRLSRPAGLLSKKYSLYRDFYFWIKFNTLEFRLNYFFGDFFRPLTTDGEIGESGGDRPGLSASPISISSPSFLWGCDSGLEFNFCPFSFCSYIRSFQ